VRVKAEGAVIDLVIWLARRCTRSGVRDGTPSTLGTPPGRTDGAGRCEETSVAGFSPDRHTLPFVSPFPVASVLQRQGRSPPFGRLRPSALRRMGSPLRKNAICCYLHGLPDRTIPHWAFHVDLGLIEYQDASPE